MRSSSRNAPRELDRAVREQRRRNRLGEDAACATCGTTTLLHLAKVSGLVLCQCCLAIGRGRRILELHHIAGHHEGPGLVVCGNCHAELSELQRGWPSGLSFTERFSRGLGDITSIQNRKDNPDA